MGAFPASFWTRATRNNEIAEVGARLRMTRAAAISTEASATTPATDVLSDGGTAIDAVIAGFLAAAGSRPGVLFSPVQILVVGPGVGARAIDGRGRQPGLGAPRPRGFVPKQPIPDAAYAAVPASIGALAVAHAHDHALGLGRLCKPAIDIARHQGAAERARLLERVAMYGAALLRESAIARPLVAAAGRIGGGLLTEEDLASVRPETDAPREIGSAGQARRTLTVPWGALLGDKGRLCEIIAAGDRRGVLAVLAYTPDDDGVRIPEWGVTLARDGVPVLRGIPRTSPGTPCPAPKPFGILVEDTFPLLAMGARSTRTPNEARWPEIAEKASAQEMITELREASFGLRAVGVIASRAKQEMAGLVA